METSKQVSQKEELAIEAALNAALLLPNLAFLNTPIIKQLYLILGKKLVVYVYGAMKIIGYEFKVDVQVDGANDEYKKALEHLNKRINEGASSEEIKRLRKELVDHARKLVRAGGNIVQR